MYIYTKSLDVKHCINIETILKTHLSTLTKKLLIIKLNIFHVRIITI